MNKNSTGPRGSVDRSIAVYRRQSALRAIVRTTLLCLSLIMMSRTSQATANACTQDLEEIQVTLGGDKESLKNIFRKIEHQTQFRFSFFEDHINSYSAISFPSERRSVKATLDLAFEGLPLTYVQKGKMVYIRKKELPASTGALAAPPYFISGKVTTAQTNEPMAGVNILVKGTTNGTTTDAEGAYVIEANEDDILVFSFIGHKTVEEPVSGRTNIAISLEEEIEALDEVVVNGGYYLTTDRKKTGNIAKVTGKEIENQPVASPLLALQGRMAGVDVTPQNGVPGSSVTIQIRGQNSLRTGGTNGNGNLPLYIIDGVPIDSRPLLPASETMIGLGFDPLSTISPTNIESIEVLKDADATAIYGSRGANGVILITTKQGSGTSKPSLEMNAYMGFGKVSKEMDLMNTGQYIAMRKEAFANDATEPGLVLSDYDLLSWDTTRYTNWQKVIMGGTSHVADIQGGISGGINGTSFRLGGGWHKETLVLPGDFGYRRGYANVSMNHLSSDKKFTALVNVNYGSDNNKLFDDQRMLNAALKLPPNAPEIYSSDGELNWENSTFENPFAGLKNVHDYHADNLVSNGNLSYEVIEGLRIRSNIGYSDLNSVEFIKYPLAAYDPAFVSSYTGASAEGTNRRKTWIIEPQLTFNKNTTIGDLDVVGGMTFQESNYMSRLINAGGYQSDVLLENIKAAPIVTFTRNDNSQYRYTSIFARLGYDFKSRYFINLTGRRDGSSRFGPGNRFANFGAVGVGWIFTNEKWFSSGAKILSFGKIRGSYGVTGNDQIGDYKYYNMYSLVLGTYQGGASMRPTSLFNPDFAWEVTRKLELATELSFFNDRLSIEASWYRNISSNQLIDYTLPFTTGFSSVLSNLSATIRNSGLEFVIRSQNIRGGSVQWTTSANLTLPRNKLVSFPGIENSTYADVYVVGEPVTVSKAYVFDGVNSETGVYDIQDVVPDGAMNSLDRTYLFNLSREFYGGVSNTVSWKGLELSFLIQYSKKMSYSYGADMPGSQNNQPVSVMARWQRSGDVSEIQKYSQDIFGPMANSYNLYRSSNAVLSDASFIRLKALTLGYVLPAGFVDRMGLRSLNFYLQSQNLFTITDFVGLDPETASALPPLRTITIGIQVKI